MSYYLQRAGFQTTDKKVLRLLSLSAQKFLSDVVSESRHFCQLQKDKKHPVLTNEILASSLAEYGVRLSKPEYYSDSVTTTIVKKVNKEK